MFVRSMTIADLGPGAGYALWAFRAAAVGRIGCCALVSGFDEAFGPIGEEARDAIAQFAHILGNEGGRMIRLSQPGCARVTADELSLVAALAAAQGAEKDRRDAHLAWLTCGRGEIAARTAAERVAAVFAAARMPIMAPAVDISPPHGRRPLTVHRMAGSA